MQSVRCFCLRCFFLSPPVPAARQSWKVQTKKLLKAAAWRWMRKSDDANGTSGTNLWWKLSTSRIPLLQDRVPDDCPVFTRISHTVQASSGPVREFDSVWQLSNKSLHGMMKRWHHEDRKRFGHGSHECFTDLRQGHVPTNSPVFCNSAFS